MHYNVLETKIKFNSNGSIHNILALVEYSKGDVRVIEVTDKPKVGYMSVSHRSDYVLYDLMQEVADYGMEITDVNKIPSEWAEKYFK